MTGSQRRSPAADAAHFEFRVPARPSSLGMVRRALFTLRDQCPPEVVEALALIYSELMTNAIRHAGVAERESIDVVLEIAPDGVRGSVTDPGPGFTPATAPTPRLDGEGGYGLRIVDQLTRSWGVRRGERTEVWFEL